MKLRGKVLKHVDIKIIQQVNLGELNIIKTIQIGEQIKSRELVGSFFYKKKIRYLNYLLGLDFPFISILGNKLIW